MLKLSTECMEEARFWDLVELAKWPCDYEKMKIKYLKILTAVECKAFRKTLSAAFSMLDGVYSGVDLCVSDNQRFASRGVLTPAVRNAR